MSTPSPEIRSYSSRPVSRVRSRESFFALFGGPLAWFLQLCTGYALASGPCFRGGDRLASAPPTLAWTWLAMVLAMLVALLIALLACLVSWRVYEKTPEEMPGHSVHALDRALGRTRFLALWGVLFGGAFALATAMTAVAFLTLPRCA